MVRVYISFKALRKQVQSSEMLDKTNLFRLFVRVMMKLLLVKPELG